MARDAATIQAEIDALRARMASGVQLRRSGESEVRYFQPDQKLLDILLAELAGLSTTTTPTRQVRFTTSKGLG